MSTISPDRFKMLLERARAHAASINQTSVTANISNTIDLINKEKPTDVDLSKMGINPSDTTKSKEEIDEQITEVISDLHEPISISDEPTKEKTHTTGVAADVELNDRQKLFIETALKGEDVCLIGAAGTGKTTVTGKFIKELLNTGRLKKVGMDTKWIKSNTPGVLITSFTRKAVNNIRRAVPLELKPHVLTMHKILEFAPVFYEIMDENNPTQVKKTMRFEPQRSAVNPLPYNISLVVYEESSMIGTDLYNMMMDAMPHNPQEIFIGDIRQLPPIFGPAILGFKMSLLPTVELTDVYRQALLSPIIRLAHAVLSGDSKKFLPTGKKVRMKHPHLDKVVDRIIIPSLEEFSEESEHGILKIQPWQKKLAAEDALSTCITQFIAWEKSGYYNPAEDIILCPFNKAFGTIEINKGIQNYLGRKRKAIVHEVIAGYNKHYLAVGDRVLYDKEDATIIEIKRNANYLGKSFLPASEHLDRWGIYQENISQEQLAKLTTEETEYDHKVLDDFFELNYSDDTEEENRVNAASHEVTIQFAYSEEVIRLSGAAEVNNLMGGNAITVHKMQGSESQTIFFVLHNSHANMINNELLYTGISRARHKLHIICESDTFFKGVKTQKVRGITLQDKIEFFKGKVEFKAMQKELEKLTQQRERKKQTNAQQVTAAPITARISYNFTPATRSSLTTLDEIYDYQYTDDGSQERYESEGNTPIKQFASVKPKQLSVEDRIAILRAKLGKR